MEGLLFDRLGYQAYRLEPEPAWNEQNLYRCRTNRNIWYPGFDVPARKEPLSMVRMWYWNQETVVLSVQ